MRRVGILTGGGDVPGLNAVIKTLTLRLEKDGVEVVGLRRGWASLVNVVPYDDPGNAQWLHTLDRLSTRRLDRFGGTVLHSSRMHPGVLLPKQVPEHLLTDDADGEPIDVTPHVLEVIEYLELDALVAIGGDGTLTYAKRLHEEGVPVIAIPKTMDNDVFGTDYSLGFSTAVTRAVHHINDLRTAAGSHERFLVVELFGRYSGEPCLLASYLASSDRTLIAEVPYDFEKVVEYIVADREESPSNYAVLTVAEGARPIGGERVEGGEVDAAGHGKLGGIGAVISSQLAEVTGVRALYQPLGYMMRSGPPDSLDLLVAKNYAHLAADLLHEGRRGLMVALVDGVYRAVDVERIGEGVRRVNVDRFYDREGYQPQLRRVLNLPMFLH